MKKSIQLLNESQQLALRQRLWWVADRSKPYLIKFALENQSVILQITDLKNLWIGRYHSKTLMQDKVKFANIMQVKDSKDLLLLFDNLLSKSDVQATYTFKQNNNEMNFIFLKRIKFYDFNWTFKLQKVAFNSTQIICKQIINPLNIIIQTQYKIIESLKKRFQIIQKQYVKKLNQSQKILYRSPLIDYMADVNKKITVLPQFTLQYINLDQISLDIFKQYVKKIANKSIQQQIKVQTQASNVRPKVYKPIKSNEFQQFGQFILHEQIEEDKKKIKYNKKVNIDFL